MILQPIVNSDFRRRAVVGAGVIMLVFAAATLLNAHDLFLKPARFFVSPNDSVRIDVLNGTFTSSEASVASDRIHDLSVVGPDGLVHPPTEAWTAAGKASQWRVGLGRSGTYVLGASVLPRTLTLEAKNFNSYLEEDGLPDVLADRRARRTGQAGAREVRKAREDTNPGGESAERSNRRAFGLCCGAHTAGQSISAGRGWRAQRSGAGRRAAYGESDRSLRRADGAGSEHPGAISAHR